MTTKKSKKVEKTVTQIQREDNIDVKKGKDNSVEIRVLEAQIKEIEKGERQKFVDELEVVYEKSSLLEDIFFDEDVRSGCKDMIKELPKMQKLIDKEKLRDKIRKLRPESVRPELPRFTF